MVRWHSQVRDTPRASAFPPAAQHPISVAALGWLINPLLAPLINVCTAVIKIKFNLFIKWKHLIIFFFCTPPKRSSERAFSPLLRVSGGTYNSTTRALITIHGLVESHGCAFRQSLIAFVCLMCAAPPVKPHCKSDPAVAPHTNYNKNENG